MEVDGVLIPEVEDGEGIRLAVERVDLCTPPERRDFEGRRAAVKGATSFQRQLLLLDVMDGRDVVARVLLDAHVGLRKGRKGWWKGCVEGRGEGDEM